MSFAPAAGCPRCIEKDAVFIEVRGNVRKATELLRPFRSGSFAFYEQERARELENRLAAKKSSLTAMNQGIIEESGLLHNLVEGVLPKLRREKQFGTMFERKKNDVVVSQRNWEAMNAMIRDYQMLIKKFLKLQDSLRGTSFELEEGLSPQLTLDFLL